jgi:Dyp-type peroxidase family
VFRKLDQDVVAFWTWLAAQARRLDPADPGPLTEQLAAKLMGRWRSGAPLVLAPDADDPGKADPQVRNAFAYLKDDPDGKLCPMSSHVRRANPRDAHGGSEDESLTVVQRHRILRRGRTYGPPLAVEAAIAGRDDGQRRGLYFISLQASIARGFEFIQQTWLSNLGFAGGFDEADPITGPSGCCFTVPADPLRLRLHALPRVVTTAGGGYFMLPSLATLEWVAKLA